MSDQPVTLDMSTATPINSADSPAPPNTGGVGGSGVKLDMSTAQPIDAPKQDEPGAIHVGMNPVKALAAVGAGVGDGLLSTITGAAAALGLPHATLDSRLAELKRDNAENPTLNWLGKSGETVAELMGGDEALKGLSMAEKLSKMSKVAELLANHPVLASAAKAGLVGGAQGTARSGGSLAEGAKEGAVTALGGAAVEGAPAIKSAATEFGGGVKDAAGDIYRFNPVKSVKSVLQNGVSLEDGVNMLRKFGTDLADNPSRTLGKLSTRLAATGLVGHEAHLGGVVGALVGLLKHAGPE